MSYLNIVTHIYISFGILKIRYFVKQMESSPGCISEKQLENLLSTLTPTKIAALEKTLKSYQNKCQPNIIINISNDKENDGLSIIDSVIKSEPIETSKNYLDVHKIKNRGLTYENGRRNLKSEPVTDEEKERRAKRRERNRVAAQKCRERRHQQIQELQEQVDVLRLTEKKLYFTLKELEDEEINLRIKLTNHNYVISESSTGDLLIGPNFCNSQLVYSKSFVSNTELSSKTLSRPRSLPMTYNTHNDQPSTSLDQFVPKDESFTPLLSPDSYSILKYQIKTDSTPTTPSQTIENIAPKLSDQSVNVAFSWNNSIVDQLSMPSLDAVANSNYLSTPLVDAPFYTMDHHYSQNENHHQSMNWQ